MATPPPLQTRFSHAVEYASVLLQMVGHVYPGKGFTELSPDQRRIVANEAEQLLVQARWRVESAQFAEWFATPQTPPQSAPAGTVLGEKPVEGKPPGQYA